MLDQIFGLILLSLGLRHTATPNVLGDATTATGSSTTLTHPTLHPSGDYHVGSMAGAVNGPHPTLRVLVPVMTQAQEEAFQKDRALAEGKIKGVIDTRTQTLENSFLQTLKRRTQEDEASHTAFLHTVNAFKDATKKQTSLTIADTYQTTITNVLTAMQKKLESMLALLDKISVAAAILQKQGKDISVVDSDVTAAQAKVTSALTMVSALAGSLPTTLSVTSEASAGADIQHTLTQAKTKLGLLYTAFTDARKAVGVALTDLESLTKAIDVVPTP